MKAATNNHRRRRRQSSCCCRRKNNGSIAVGYRPLAFCMLACFLIGATLESQFRLRQDRHREYLLKESIRKAVISIRKGQLQKSQQNATTSLTTSHQDSNRSHRHPTTGGLQIAWLMSFPNSGTSYTLKLIRHLSLTKSASNYGNEDDPNPDAAEPVFDDQPEGPFWTDNRILNLTRPAKYVLTKTHCGGRCNKCLPNKYVESTFSFRNRCLLSRHNVWINQTNYSNNNTNGKATGWRKEPAAVVGSVTSQEGTYPTTRIRKAVHLVRDPFDNVVSRFHLENHHLEKKGTPYPWTRNGFRSFCRDLSRTYKERSHVFFGDILPWTAKVPCRADFFRYVEWHNMALITSQDLELDTYVLHYDWFETKWNATAKELLDFLGLESKGATGAPFAPGKVYRDYFTAEERLAVKRALEAMASRATWKLISHYFFEDDDE